MFGQVPFPMLVVGIVAMIAAATDLWKFKVYNALTFPAILLGLVVSGWVGGADGLVSSVLGAALGFGLLVVFFAFGGVGAGDVKLLTAVGAWLGPALTLQVFLASALACGAYALVLIAIRDGLGTLVMKTALLVSAFPPLAIPHGEGCDLEAEVRRPDRRRRLVPFAAMICLGYVATLVWCTGDRPEPWGRHHARSADASAIHPAGGGGR